MYKNELDDISKEEMEMLLKFSEDLVKALCDLAVTMNENITFRQTVSEVSVNNNGRTCIASSYNDGKTAAPVIYPDELYSQYLAGRSIEEIALQQYDIVSHSRSNGLSDFDPNKITKDDLSKNLFFDIVNKDINPRVLEACPYIEVTDDLIALPRYNIGTIDNSAASFAFSYKNMDYYEVGKEEVFNMCWHNNHMTRFSVKSMRETLEDIWRSQGVPEENIDSMLLSMPEEETMYVITAPTYMNGSAALLNDEVLQEVAGKFGQSCLIIPSSRMELIAVPDTIPAEEVLEMVKSVNTEVLSQKDYLATNVYRYNTRSHELRACFDRYGKIIEYDKERIQYEHTEKHALRRVM